MSACRFLTGTRTPAPAGLRRNTPFPANIRRARSVEYAFIITGCFFPYREQATVFFLFKASMLIMFVIFI